MRLVVLLTMVVAAACGPYRLSRVVCTSNGRTLFASDSIAWYMAPAVGRSFMSGPQSAEWRFYAPAHHRGGNYLRGAMSAQAECIVTPDGAWVE